MGHKVNPISMRLQVNKDWRSKWFTASKREYAEWLQQDFAVRDLIERKFATRAVINKIDIERAPNLVTVTVHTAKAGVVIGRGGSGAQELKAEIEKVLGKQVRLNIEEVKRPELASKIVAENIARQLERRINWRRAVKMASQNVMNAGAKGVRIQLAGRLGGADMSRHEKETQGSVPLHTLRADVDYHQAIAQLPNGGGVTGIKVWIYKGEVQ
jgi:small subunit ribosomal protein S3